MTLAESDIDKITGLAHLKLNSEEKQRLFANLQNILKCMEIIDEIDMEKPLESQQVLSQQALLRDDIFKREPIN